MLDMADCQDLISLQALLCMILYTQVSSMMSTCYSYICIAVAASLQMGLFTEDASKDLSETERLYRRRIFCVLNIMDTYVTTALGLPRTLRDVKSDHLTPCTKRPNSGMDPMAGTYAHAELIQILASVVESNHPVTRWVWCSLSCELETAANCDHINSDQSVKRMASMVLSIAK